jgi:hypothetical protein
MLIIWKLLVTVAALGLLLALLTWTWTSDRVEVWSRGSTDHVDAVAFYRGHCLMWRNTPSRLAPDYCKFVGARHTSSGWNFNQDDEGTAISLGVYRPPIAGGPIDWDRVQSRTVHRIFLGAAESTLVLPGGTLQLRYFPFAEWLATLSAIPLLAQLTSSLRRIIIRSRRKAACLCLTCGYDVRENRLRCPECGMAWRTPGDRDWLKFGCP